MNRACIGRTYSYLISDAYEVGREHIRKFADAIEDENPLYRDRELARAAGYADIPAPPTFLAVIPYARLNPLNDPELGVDKTRGLHAGHRFVHHRPVVAGDQVMLEITIADIRDAGAHELLEMRSVARTIEGALLSTITHTTIFRGDEPAEHRPATVRQPGSPGGSVDPDLPTIVFATSRQELVRYSGASGEYEPIHWSDTAAREAGLEGVIAHGLFTLTKVAQAAVAWTGDPGRVRELGARFTRPLVIPERGTVELTVAARETMPVDNGGRQVELDVTSGGIPVLGAASVVLA
jgi:acyl dehydratase